MYFHQYPQDVRDFLCCGAPFDLIHKNFKVAKLIKSLFCRFEEPELLQQRRGFAAVWWMCSCISMSIPQCQHGFCPLNDYRSQSSNDPARTLIISSKVFYCENCYKPVQPDTSCANDFHGVLHFTDRENNASQTNSVQQQTLCWSTALLSLSLTVSVTVLFPTAMTQKKKPRSCRTLNFKLSESVVNTARLCLHSPSYLCTFGPPSDSRSLDVSQARAVWGLKQETQRRR